MTYKPGIAVVVVNWQTPDDLRRCLQSYEDYRCIESDLIVVNNEPTTDDLQVASDFPAYHIVNKENVGYARAVNAGVKASNREMVAILNADTELRPGVLYDCWQALVNNPSWGVLGPRQLDRKGRVTHGGIFGTLNDPAWRVWLGQDDPEYGDVRPAVTVMGSAYFARRRMWDELTACHIYQKAAPGAEGAFLPTKLFFEETYCSYHAKVHGWEVIYYGRATMIHDWHNAISKPNSLGDHQFHVSQELFRKACDLHGIPHD